jgi:type IV pilus assembly protein PilP
MNAATTLDGLVFGKGLRARTRRMLGMMLVVLAMGAHVSGCGDEEEQATGRGLPGGKPGAPKATGKGAGAKGGASVEKLDLEPLVLKDDDFSESVRNRDPFRSYSTAFRAKAPDEMQRRVVMPTTSVEDMRLIAIVTGTPQPKAMLVDPSGVGYVVQRGDYVGRPKVIQATGSVSMALNWRVDRIRDNEVVLTQQDPAEPTRAALTKIIPLRDEVAQR